MTVDLTQPGRGRRPLAAAAGLIVHAAPGWLAAQAALTVIGAAVPVAVAWLTKLVLDRLAHARSAADLAALAVGLAVAGLLAGALPQIDQYVRSEQERAVRLLAQERLYGAVDRLVGLRPFEDPVFLDRLRLAGQAGGTAPSQVVDGALAVARGAVTAGGFLASLVVLSPVMAAVVVAAAGPALLAERALARRRAAMMWAISPAERREFLYAALLASARTAQEVRLFGIGPLLRGRMLAERRAANDAQRRMDRRELVSQGGLGLLAAVVAGGGLVYAVLMAAAGTLTVGDVAMFVAAVGGVQSALSTMVSTAAQVRQHLLTFDHFLAVTTARPDLPVAARPRPLPPLRVGIELRDVWFRYSDSHPWVLRGVNLVLPSGQDVALVGRNGSGKSTLVKLLCRFYDPTRGSILWDGVDLRDVDPAALRERIGAVFQEFVRYDMTAADNIGLGDVARLDDRPALHRAARQAGVHEVLAGLPRGYDTLLSREFYDDPDEEVEGVTLSGGQWQRVALARGLLRTGRDLLILDEPSSGLDAEAEAEIHRRLRTLRTGGTRLLISHRLGAIRDADRIVVLDDGRVVEQGTHDQLMACDGSYARLFRLQAAGYQDGSALAARGA